MARGVVIAIALAAATSSRAEMPARLSVAGQGACPTAAALARALERLHPTLHADVDAQAGVRVEVVDGGRSYEVRAGERSRRLDDEARRCGERATAAALAVTLLLDPPTAPPPEEPEGPLAPRRTPEEGQPPATGAAGSAAPPSPTPTATTATGTATTPTSTPTPTPPTSALPETPRASAPASAPTRTIATPAPLAARATEAPGSLPPPATAIRRAPPRPTPRPSRIDLELAGVVDGAPASGSAASEITGGAALRLALGGRWVAGTLGIAGLAPATATSSGVAVTVVHIPFDAGVRLVLPLGRVELGADVGLALAILQLSAPALTGAATNTRLDVGARIAPFARVGLTARLALVLGVQMIVSFAPYELDVQPIGKIATTPRLWLGGGLGLAVRL